MQNGSTPRLLAKFCATLLIVFALELVVDQMLPVLLPNRSVVLQVIVDASMVALFSAPFIWWLVVRPLQRSDLVAKAQSELRKSEARFRNLADNAPVGIFETDSDGHCIFANRKWCEIAGIPSSAAIGRGWSGALHPDDAEFIAREWYDSVREGRPFSLEYRFRTPEGQENWVLGSAASFRNEVGAIIGYMGVIIDINQRRKAERNLSESEERFRTVFEQSEDAIVLFAPGGCTIIDLNATTEKLFGYTKSELIGRGFDLFKSREEYHDFIHSVCMLRGQQTCHLDHIVGLCRDGSEFHVSVRAKVIRLLGDEVIYCTLRDITLRLRMEEEARSIQSQLIHTNKMTSLGLLVAGIAHEINNPNNYIMANSQMLYKIWEDLDPLLKREAELRKDFKLGGLPYDKLEEAFPEMIASIDEGARRIKDIIGDLKHYSRRGTSVTELVDLNQVVHSSLKLLMYQINKYTDRFMMELEEPLPPICGSSQQLEQVVVNLVMNALQALTQRSQALVIRTVHEKGTCRVRLVVADQGSGIPDGIRDKILEPFFTTRLDAGGTGLGLSIARSIILAHQGGIEIDSRPGEGTAITASFPVADCLPENTREL